MSMYQKLENTSSKNKKKEGRHSANVEKYKTQRKAPGMKTNYGKKDDGKESENLSNHTRPDVCDNGNVIDLSSPGLCSTLQLANEIQAASTGTIKVEELKLFQQKQLAEAIKHKAMKKANVPFTKHIFKDLIDLHIGDEDIASGKTQPKIVHFNTNKDPVFHLEDFYKPDFSTEVNITVPEQKFEVEKIDYFNGFELYERIESLKKLG